MATGLTSGETQTFRSKMGTFIFDRGVPLVTAKLIRDSVTGQYFNPNTSEPRIRTDEDAENYVRNNLDNKICGVAVEIRIEPK